MADQTQPDTDLTWDDVHAAIGAEVWKLAPLHYREHAHADLKFMTNWQDIMAAVEEGILTAAGLPDEEQTR